MREIEFRGKTISGEFVYGLLARKNDRYFISNSAGSPFAYEVIPETVGQYTGLRDSKSTEEYPEGQKIFEGDVLHLYGKDIKNKYDWKASVEFGNPNSLYSWGYQLNPIAEFGYNPDILAWIDREECGIYAEVIGNIHDNRELLRGE